MHNRYRGFLAASFSGLLALAACTKDNSSQPAAATSASTAAASSTQADEDLSDITRYRLSMDKIDKYIQSQKNLAAKVKSMSPAEREAFKNNDDVADANASIDEMVAKIDKQPVMAEAIKSAGLSTREWVMVTMSMMQTGMAAAVVKMRPNDNQDSLMREMKVNPENVKWYTEHEAEITAKTKAIEAEMKALEGDNG